MRRARTAARAGLVTYEYPVEMQHAARFRIFEPSLDPD